ncbi:MAG TPA: A/G-specific adenine glycosylase [Parafilimonas sp.]|nr:A/G-specific adenine glycosylase [Parafilimonas sp.]
MKSKKLFRELLLTWHRKKNKRVMPWKGEKDPYKVWLSEIILQQTRVEQGLPYYEKFIRQYPTITHLANAREEDVFKLWEGLGYYTRCRNLLSTARIVAENYAGSFPSDYDSIIKLKGIGAYTASAVASFCFNLPHAVVDGNVLRVLSRFFGIYLPVDSAEGKKIFAQLAQECLDKDQPGEYNQSIMDFGATVCKPVPVCKQCPLNKKCMAFNSCTVTDLPVKQKKIVKKERWFSYFIFSFNDEAYVQLRREKDIWQNLYEFYLKETATDPEWNAGKIKNWLELELKIDAIQNITILSAKKQLLTHQVIHGYFICVSIGQKPLFNLQKGLWLNSAEIKTKAFPKFIHQFTGKETLQTQLL